VGSDPEKEPLLQGIEISDDDVYEAMKDIEGYLDITPQDLKELYRRAYAHAVGRITGSVLARHVMTQPVTSVRRLTPLREVADVMAKRAVSGVPVLEEDGRVAGVISEKDFLAIMGSRDRMHFMGVIAECMQGHRCLALPVRKKNAEDIMTTPAVTVTVDTPVKKIAELFASKHINRVPVVDASGMLLGIVSREDLVRASLRKA